MTIELFNYYRDEYGPGDDDRMVISETAGILNSIPVEFHSEEHLKRIFSLIDLTSLNSEDNEATARKLTDQINGFSSRYPDIPPVAAVCVYPTLVEEIRNNLVDKRVKLAAVGAGFPSSQTFLSVKLAECELLAKKGADEIDVVISVGKLLAGDYRFVLNELILIREATQGCTLKVILETGILRTALNIRLASLIAMEAGADFIKTSTGKGQVSATPEAVYVMLRSIRDFFSRTGRNVGIKPAGGIASVNDSVAYYSIVNKVIGQDWIKPALFRIGASRLANNLIGAITGTDARYF